MANKVDIRIVKTKDKLKKTLVHLLATKTIDEISISEICNDAGINRNTFYAHYSDIKSLLEDVKSEYLEMLLVQIRTEGKFNDHFQKYIGSLLEMMKTNCEVSKLLFGNHNSDSFLKTVVMFALPSDLKELSFESNLIESEDIYQFLVGGIENMIHVWVSDGFKDNSEDIGMKIAFFIQCFKTSFRRV